MISSPWTTATDARLSGVRGRLSCRVLGKRESEPQSGWREVFLLPGSRISFSHDRRPTVAGVLRVAVPPTGTGFLARLRTGVVDLEWLQEVMIYAGYTWPDAGPEEHPLAHLIVTGYTRHEAAGTLTYDLEVQSGEWLADNEAMTNSTAIRPVASNSPTIVFNWLKRENYIRGPYPHAFHFSYPDANPTGLNMVYAAMEFGPFATVGTVLTAMADGAIGRWIQADPAGDLRRYEIIPQASVDKTRYHDARIGRIDSTFHGSLEEDWANTLVVHYKGSIGESSVPAGRPIYRSLIVDRHQHRNDGANVTAKSMRSRANARVRSVAFTARAHWGLRPGHTVHDPAWSAVTTGRHMVVRSVDFDLTAGTMTVTASPPPEET